jgi:short-subunit dehydrogenase
MNLKSFIQVYEQSNLSNRYHIMKNTALITGASSGIGKELARIHAAKGGDLILVARRSELLNSLKEELVQKYKVTVQVIQKDLSVLGSSQAVYDEVTQNGWQVDYLFNNAGFGGKGAFLDRDLEADVEMVRLNVMALLKLTHLFGKDMKARGKGKILQTASTAGFLPGPYQNTYFATKAFVVSHTQGLAHELKGSGVTVTALCPGPVDTEFAQVAGFGGSQMFDGAASAYKTALKGYNAMEKGKVICISDFKFTFLIKGLLPFMPSSITAAIIAKMQQS